MVGAGKIDDIRRLGRGGASVASIARDAGASEPTVRKYPREADLSERPPAVGGGPEPPLPESFAGLVDSRLLEDRRRRHRQRHAARRVYDRLVEERGPEGSCTTVQRRVKRRREGLAAELDAREAQGFLLLDWPPGGCQVDFGQRGHFLVVAFPHSDVGPAQVFWGETAGCVRRGLRDVFEFLGGVPPRAVLDNAAEVGRRAGAGIGASALFRRFAAHCGLGYGFTDPCSGNEEGSAGNRVGAIGGNPFVPVPRPATGGCSERARRSPAAKGTTERARPSPSSSGTTAPRPPRCPPPRSHAWRGSPGSATGRARSRPAASAAAPRAPPTRPARSPSRRAPST